MEFPIIRVKNRGEKGIGFIVGTNHHHQLLLDKNKNIKFRNMQCMDGTGEDQRAGYEFVTQKGLDGDEEIKFGTIWDMINVYAEHLGVQDTEIAEEFNNDLENLRKTFDKAAQLKKKKREKIKKIIEKYFDEEFSE